MNNTPELEQQLIQEIIEQCKREEIIEQCKSEPERLQADKPKIWKHAAVGCGLGAVVGPALAYLLFVLIYDLNDIDTPIALFIQFFVLMAAALFGALIGAITGPVVMAIIRRIRIR